MIGGSQVASIDFIAYDKIHHIYCGAAIWTVRGELESRLVGHRVSI